MKRSFPRLGKFLLLLMGLMVVVTGCVRVGYGTWTAHRYEAWNRMVERSEDGVRAGCESYETGEGDVAILMVHGFASCPAVFRKMADRYAAEGYHVRSLLLPGFARPMEAYRTSGLEDWRLHLDREFDALTGSYREVWILGHSMGGTLAADFALRRPGEASGLLLYAPLFRVHDDRSPLLPSETWFHLLRPLLASSLILESLFPVDAADPELMDLNLRDTFIPVNIYDNLFRVMALVRKHEGNIRIPVFLALAEKDRIVNPDAAADWFASHVGGPHDVYRAEQSGHVVTLDLGWEEAADAGAAFIRAQGEQL